MIIKKVFMQQPKSGFINKLRFDTTFYAYKSNISAHPVNTEKCLSQQNYATGELFAYVDNLNCIL